MTKKKLKVMHEIVNDAPKLREAKGMKPIKAKHAETKTIEPETKTGPDPELERAFEALKSLGGSATSPELVKALDLSGETARDKVRRWMDKLHAAHRIHRTHELKGKVKMYRFQIAEKADTEPKADPKVEVAA